ncbi:MAG: GntR family transcriptional regulator, partial [Actinobacteria bacterium]|nr:GntR family transcriptional regulator [Actinomycetota bacterium]
MALQRVTRRSVPDEVFDQVLAEVVDGGLAPGEQLPSERRLAEVLGVSRPAVREALQRMAATRLVEVRQGEATTVRDFKRYAGLDLLPRLLVRAGGLDTAVARSVLEARLAVGPTVAALAVTDDDVERQ